MSITLIVILGAVFLLLVLLGAGYLKAPPDKAYIISGMGRRRILIGKAGWRIPVNAGICILSFFSGASTIIRLSENFTFKNGFSLLSGIFMNRF